ncbi:MAG: hypothetical protein ACI9Y7_001511 [Dokdonia sp.]
MISNPNAGTATDIDGTTIETETIEGNTNHKGSMGLM